MTEKSMAVKTFWDGFAKYLGVQGLMGLALVGGFIYASLAQIQLPDLYTNVMTLVVGFYFAKNGVGILSALKNGKK